MIKINTGPYIIPSVPVNTLVRAYNLNNVTSLQNTQNPYEGKVGQSATSDPELYKSSLGTPVVIDLTLDSVTYNDFNTNQVKTTDSITFVTVLCTVHQSKNIITTSINNRPGTVKEYIGLGDYEVTINGIITGENGKMPEQEIQALKRMLDAPVAIPVTSRFLNLLGIYYLVVKDYDIPQEPGGISTQPYTIECLSDEQYQALLL